MNREQMVGKAADALSAAACVGVLCAVKDHTDEGARAAGRHTNSCPNSEPDLTCLAEGVHEDEEDQ